MGPRRHSHTDLMMDGTEEQRKERRRNSYATSLTVTSKPSLKNLIASGHDTNVPSVQLHLDAPEDDPSDIEELSVSTRDRGALSSLVEPYYDDDDDNPSQFSHSTVALEKIAHKETQQVTRWKTFVMTLLLVNAGLVTVSTFEFMRREEDEEFQTSFYQAARTVSDASHYHANSLVDILSSFSDTVTSHALDTQTSWPLLTIPHFERRAASVRHDSFFNLFGVVPIIHDSDREAWEAYSVYKQSWIQDSYDHMASSTSSSSSSSKQSQSSPSSPSQRRRTTDSSSTHTHDDAMAWTQPQQAYQHAMNIPTVIHSPFDTTAGADDWGVSIVTNSTTTNRTDHYYAPLWQVSPPPLPGVIHEINTDILDVPVLADLFQTMNESQYIAVSLARHIDLEGGKRTLFDFYKSSSNRRRRLQTAWEDSDGSESKASAALSTPDSTASSPPTTMSSMQIPKSIVLFPIYDSFDPLTRRIQAFTFGVLPWERYFASLLPDGLEGLVVHAVLQTCGQVLTFSIDGPKATFIGEGDLHSRIFDTVVVNTTFDEFRRSNSHDINSNNSSESNSSSLANGQCDFTVSIYPTMQFYTAHTSMRPEYFALGLAILFAITGIAFLIFVYVSRHRQNKVMAIALSTSAVVSSMFPSNVRERILQDAEEDALRKMEEGKRERMGTTVERQSYADTYPKSVNILAAATAPVIGSDCSMGGSTRNRKNSARAGGKSAPTSPPIADFFPDVTVMVCDIVNFTVWCAEREPQQVFLLLETIYHAFDEIARRRRVYKVETIGDCYVACAGLPTPRDDHAILMARYARDCLAALDNLTKQLERTLGPETGELTMRFGLHSGPCTAGVLRAERARYQIFGDTVMLAAKLESTGEPGQIHISQETAELLAEAKKSSWFIPRDSLVEAKGKGLIQTYWLHPKREELEKVEGNPPTTDLETVLDVSIANNISSRSSDALRTHLSEQYQRLAEWNANHLLKLLNQVVQQRKKANTGAAIEDSVTADSMHLGWAADSVRVIDDVKICIPMPRFDPALFPKGMDNPVELPEIVIQQLHDFVAIICSMYNKHLPCHNYQHASHVTMSLTKLMSRILSPGKGAKTDEQLYEKSFGIAVDPMAQFALAFAALICKVDHPGCTNAQLVREKSRLARIYGPYSICEQNSFQTAWDLLMDPMFAELRTAIFANREEFDRFRQLLVNAVMATDQLRDDERNEARELRWEKAFLIENIIKEERDDGTTETTSVSGSTMSDRKKLNFDRKATLLIECVMQISSMSSKMQHWNVYRKWNERSFQEACRAYQKGRESRNPPEIWYQDQLDLFDNVVIPLARKIKECGVLGAFSDDYLDNAKRNREEWFRKGNTMVQSMERSFAQKHNDKAPRTPSRPKLEVENHNIISGPAADQMARIRRSHSADSLFHHWDELTGKLSRRKSMDGAPRAPMRSSCNDSVFDPQKAVAELFAGLPDLRDRTSSADAAPQHPRRSFDKLDLEDPAKVVQDMFDAMPKLKRKSSDDIPQHPRRSRDSLSLADDANVVAAMIAQEEAPKGTPVDSIPKTPHRSRDSVEFQSIIEQLYDTPTTAVASASTNMDANNPPKQPSRTSDSKAETALDTSFTTTMSPSLNSQSADKQPTIGDHLSKSDMSPRTPVRRRATDDDCTVATMERIPEQTCTFTSSPSPTSLRLPNMMRTSTNTNATHATTSVASTVFHANIGDNKDEFMVRGRNDEAENNEEDDYAYTHEMDQSCNDESTILTMGHLWNSHHQADWASQTDDSSTVLTKEKSRSGRTRASFATKS